MFTIKSIHINNFKLISHIELNDLPPTQWIFITGENGFGKTLFLQAIATSLQPIDDIINDTIADSGPRMTSKILLHSGHSFGIEVGTSGQASFERNSNFSFLVCYGSSRLETLPEISQREMEASNTGINRLFNERTILRNIEFELLRWKLRSELRNTTELERENLITRINWVKELFVELMDLADMTIDEREETVLYFEKDPSGSALDGVKKEFLGSGYKAILGIIGDLIIQLYLTQPENTDPNSLVGVVLIDEIELHLHPRWQKRLPKVLSIYFPNVQFVSTTHSPIPLLGAPENSIFLKIDRTVEDGITINRLIKLERDLKYLLPNSIFTSEIFGFNEIESEYEPRIDALRTSSSYEEIDELERAKRRLRNMDESNFPEDLFNTEG